MIQLNKLKLFPFGTREISIPNRFPIEYSLIVYPENVEFLTAYPALNIKKMYVRKLLMVGARYPKLIVTAKMARKYKESGLLPIRTIRPKTGNVFVDLTNYLNAIDAKLGKGSYRRTVVSERIKGYLNSIRESQQNRKKVLMYILDLNSDLPRLLHQRRIWPILQMYREEEHFPFDYFLLVLIRDGIVKYYAFVNEQDSIPFTKMRARLITMQSIKPDFVIDDESSIAAEKTVGKLIITPNPEPLEKNDERQQDIGEEIETPPDAVVEDKKIDQIEEEKELIQYTVDKYLKHDPEIRKQVIAGKINYDSVYSLASKSVLYSISGNKKLADSIVDSTPIEKRKELFDRVKRQLLDDIVPHNKPQNNSRDFVISKVNVPKILEDKEPSHLLNKRKLDFSKIFSRDLRNSFKVLESKEYPLKVISMTKKPVDVDEGDLSPSLFDEYSIVLQDDRKKKHPIKIRIPRIQEDGSFLLNGTKKYSIYQNILDPIFFIKPGQAKLQTIYATISIHLIKTRLQSYFSIHIGGYSRIPLAAFMGFFYGLEDSLKTFGIKYNITSDEPPNGSKYLILLNDKYIVFSYSTNYAEEFINSLIKIPYKFAEEDIFSKDVFSKVLIKIIGTRNCTFLINEVASNIMEPVSVQVLRSKLQPFTLKQIILYICKELVKGRVDDRNDISKQRIRSSEVFIAQIQGLINGSYTTYKFKRISGDKDAKYTLDVSYAVKELINSKLVRTLENINPIEELSCFTRLTPVGEGGIPDDNAITPIARSIHDTYYGNIDPMDTPEGKNVGIINQLAVNAGVTSARGSFLDKASEKNENAGAFGVNSVMVPYLNSTDGNRVMFAGSQGRQAIPINGSEPPLVQTGYETIMTSLLSDSYIKKAADNGVIEKVTKNSIVVKLDGGKRQIISLDPRILRSDQGLSSLNYFTPVVSPGVRVKKNQILAEGKHIRDGVISVGTNLLCAVMQWKGFSYEDGYIISDRVAKEKLTSTAYFEKDYKILVKRNEDIKYIAEEGMVTKKGDPLLVRASKDIEALIGLDIDEIQQGQLVTKSPGGKIISLEIYPNSSINQFPALKEPFSKFKKKYLETHKTFPRKFTSKIGSNIEQYSGVMIIFKIEHYMPAELGDKLTNNFGGKGVIAQIEKYENMPLTPWGEHVDIILNPLAIINRMNPSTIKELYTSLIAKFLAKKIVSYGTKKNSRAINLVHSVLSALDNTKSKQYSSDTVMALRKMSDKVYAAYIQKIVDNGYLFPIIVPAFKEPTIEQIRKALAIVGAKPAYYLKLKEYNTRTMRPVAVGYLYYKKLEQQSDIKMSARSTGMVDPKTRQAVAGKKMGGGQRIGEFDSWAIIDHGATNVLREFFGPLSDDHVTKDQIVSDIIQTGSANYRTPKSSPTKERLDILMSGMMLDTNK